MSAVLLRTEELACRGSAVRQILKPLARTDAGPAWDRGSARGGMFWIAAYDGARPGTEYRDWRFATVAPHYHAGYYEHWKPIEPSQQRWHLQRAYLTIFHSEVRNEEVEILALHCDPEEPDDTAGLAKYKRGPHVHVVAAQYPLSKAHLALARGHLDEVLRTCDTLTNALTWSIEMIRHEILDRLIASP